MNYSTLGPLIIATNIHCQSDGQARLTDYRAIALVFFLNNPANTHLMYMEPEIEIPERSLRAVIGDAGKMAKAANLVYINNHEERGL